MIQYGYTVVDPRTGEEPDLRTIARTEEWARHLLGADGFAVMADGILVLLDTCGNYAYCPTGRFEVRWEQSPSETT